MQKDLAPIVLFVYNRPEHTLKTLQALKENYLADQSLLYIYSDGPKKNAKEVDLERISQVRNLIKKDRWCNEVRIIENKINQGLANSVIDGVTEILNKHGKIIVLEDDIITGAGFLNFMNQALNIYQNDSNVYQISGFTFKNNLINKQTYFLPLICSWGWATWSRAWKLFENDGLKLLNCVNNENLKDFNFGGYNYFSMLTDYVEKRNDSWAIRFYASVFLRRGLTLFPDMSLVVNIGFDNSGTHSKEFKIGDEKTYNELINLERIDVRLAPEDIQLYKKLFNQIFIKNNLSLLVRIKTALNKIFKSE